MVGRGRRLNELPEAGAGIGESPGRQLNVELVEGLPYHFHRFISFIAKSPFHRLASMPVVDINWPSRLFDSTKELAGIRPPPHFATGSRRDSSGRVPMTLESRHLDGEIPEGGGSPQSQE